MHPVNKRHRFKISLKKARKRVPRWWGSGNYERSLLAARNTTKMCSCANCGNQRRSFHNKGPAKLTMQERKNLE